jgi:hypothetical protein
VGGADARPAEGASSFTASARLTTGPSSSAASEVVEGRGGRRPSADGPLLRAAMLHPASAIGPDSAWPGHWREGWRGPRPAGTGGAAKPVERV